MEERSSIREQIRRVGTVLGLDAVGFADAEPTPRTEFLRVWWSKGFGGDMDYIGRRLEERVDPRLVLTGVQSLIVVGLACPPEETEDETPADAPSTGRVARYAGGDDYHDVLLDRVRALEAALPEIAGQSVSSRSYVDTGPVAERAAAEAAGLGWIGKNSCLILPELGSHVMLGVILCDLELERDEAVTDHCGTCRACLDVCPTDAFAEPYVLDATRCISYTTIESRGPIPLELRADQGDHVFGCDLCQTVCPWNLSRPRVPLADALGLRERMTKREVWNAPTLEWILNLDAESFAEATRRTALKRAGHQGLMRNALVSAGNSRDARLREAVRRHLASDDSLLVEHAQWALDQIDSPPEGGA